MGSEDIAYQNKDITSKMLAENFKGKSFRVYGLNIPPVRRAEPTNIPAVKANELRIDNLFELADGSAAIVDYESDYDKADKIKYLNYLAGIASRYQNQKKQCPILRMIVIYTGDVQRSTVSSVYDIGAVKVNVEPAFLSELDAESIFERLHEKVEKKQRLTDEELMELIILPLSYRRKEDKKRQIRESVRLAAKIQDRNQQIFTLAGILAFTDKVIDWEMAEEIRKEICMTKVASLFENEKQEALTKVARLFELEKQEALTKAARQHEEEKQEALTKAARQHEEEKQKALTKAARQYEEDKEKALTKAARQYEEAVEKEKQKAADSYKHIVISMIQKNYTTNEIVSLVTDYSREQVDALRKSVAADTKDAQ